MVKLATIAVGLAVAAATSPGFAQSIRTSATRAQAIRECNAAAEKYSEHLWGSVSRQIYRSCMARLGQKE